MEHEGQEPHHDALVGFRRVLGHGERVIDVDLPVHVGHLDLRFNDRRFLCQGRPRADEDAILVAGDGRCEADDGPD